MMKKKKSATLVCWKPFHTRKPPGYQRAFSFLPGIPTHIETEHTFREAALFLTFSMQLANTTN